MKEGILKSIFRLGYHQSKNLVKIALRKPLNYPSLGSMTIDKDDVNIAKTLLHNRETWNHANIVKEYEEKFAKWNGSKYAFAFMGGRVALSACIYALGLKKDDEVILPGYTCVVVPNAFHFVGVKTIFCDIELETYGLDAGLIEKKITPKTKAIMLHHLYGLVCRDFEKIISIANKYNLRIIEDCAHSTGAIYKDKRVGNYGDVSFYSSEQSKVFTTIQGGIACTNDEKLAARIRRYYNNAPVPDENWIEKVLSNVVYNYYTFKHPMRWLLSDIMPLLYSKKRLISTTHEEECGIKPAHYGMKMPSPIAALGINQLNKIDKYNQKRRETAKLWDKWCEQNGYTKPVVIKNSTPVYLRYPVMVEEEKKKDTTWAKKELGVQLGVWFVNNAHPVHIFMDDCKKADEAVRRCVNFPTLGVK